MTTPARRALPVLIVVAIAAALMVGYRLMWRAGPTAVVVYCAHDAVFAEGLFQEFTRRTGIPVSVRYDSEATKSLGLVERLIQEGERPACDVFWNNELLGTMDLDRRGLLAAYQGEGWKRIPAQFKQADGRWAGFAARLRMIIGHEPASAGVPLADSWVGDLHRAAIAKPLYGTTLTHYCVLWSLLGGDAVKAWHEDCRRRGVREVDGNSMVKELVSSGACDFGYVDTDDAFAILDEKKVVRMVPVRVGNGRTIVIPNTVAILRGAPHLESARRLVDFLLSADGEMFLSMTASRQIPLGPINELLVPEAVRDLRPWVADGLPLTGLLTARDECLAWLKSIYAP